ncbi:TGS domain-containing protein, partial [Candidatus Woesearchaeota archaeon]|nr:TGS domain-containing protein [Candidatus Woesearchaeota archaeon]
LVFNKVDLLKPAEVEKLRRRFGPDLMMSAKNRDHLDELRELIYSKLDLINIFLKEPTKTADMKIPLIMFRNCTTRDVCRKLHKDFENKFKFSRIWGPSAKFDGQRLMLKHRLKDGDVVELHMR